MELIGVFFISSGLLILAGVAKAVRPDDTARAFVLLLNERTAHLPGIVMMRRAVRVGAAAELMVGVLALMFPRPNTAALVAASYFLFVIVTAYAGRSGGPLATCGCFARPDTPATTLHVMLNAVLLAAAIVVGVHPPTVTSLGPLLAHQPWHGLPLMLASGVGVWLTYLALSPLAALEGARRLVQRPARETTELS